jgi:hypothetical protein
VQFEVPADCLCLGENRIGLKRLAETPGFHGSIEVRKCILDLSYPKTFAPGRI